MLLHGEVANNLNK